MDILHFQWRLTTVAVWFCNCCERCCGARGNTSAAQFLWSTRGIACDTQRAACLGQPLLPSVISRPSQPSFAASKTSYDVSAYHNGTQNCVNGHPPGCSSEASIKPGVSCFPTAVLAGSFFRRGTERLRKQRKPTGAQSQGTSWESKMCERCNWSRHEFYFTVCTERNVILVTNITERMVPIILFLRGILAQWNCQLWAVGSQPAWSTACKDKAKKARKKNRAFCEILTVENASIPAHMLTSCSECPNYGVLKGAALQADCCNQAHLVIVSALSLSGDVQVLVGVACIV